VSDNPELSRLKRKFLRHLIKIGYHEENGIWIPPKFSSKEDIREIARPGVLERIKRAEPCLRPREDILLESIAEGNEIIPRLIFPKIVRIRPETKEELLFRYAALHWSIPVSSGYGRRLRFLIIDENSAKLIGIIGMGDPVFNLREREKWIGWDKEMKNRNLRSVMDAFVLGAIPPFSNLLFGKFIAMATVSREVRQFYDEKYLHTRSLISGERREAPLALITTMSALGKSSIYDRISYFENQKIMKMIGTTLGTGDFHLNNGFYKDLFNYVKINSPTSCKNEKWGTGFRNRREVILKFLKAADLNDSILTHGIEREIFVAPTAMNSREYLRGEDDVLDYYDWKLAELYDYFTDRWMLPRAARRNDYLKFNSSSWKIWT